MLHSSASTLIVMPVLQIVGTYPRLAEWQLSQGPGAAGSASRPSRPSHKSTGGLPEGHPCTRACAESGSPRETTALNEDAQLLRAGVKRTPLVSVRMSSIKGFGDKDPRHALKILRLLSVDAMKAYMFAMLGLTSYKYHMSTLAEKLVDASIYPSLRSAAMPAAQAVRYLYEVAMEVGDASTRELLCWNTAQHMLQGHASRGAGIVAANEDAKALIVRALDACVKRLDKREQSAEQHERDGGRLPRVSCKSAREGARRLQR